MWNAAAVLAALRATFPVSSGVHVVSWDASLAAARDVALMSELYARADVVVTGAGLHHVHHGLLKQHAMVVDVEREGVLWEDVDARGRLKHALQMRGFLPYEIAQLRAGVLSLSGPRMGDVDYAALRANADYRVNVRAVVRAVGVALARGELARVD